MRLKIIRATLACLCLCGFTMLVFLPEIALALHLDWLAKIQLGPALAGASLTLLAIVLVISVIFGRIYCSIICPLGIFQDLWMPFKSKFRWLQIPFWPRLIMPAIFITALTGGAMLIYALLDPYSIFTRMLTMASGHATAPSWLALALGFAIALAWLARKYGRIWCNTLCPIGAVLGGLNKLALFKIHHNASLCTRCGACGKICKGSCINLDKRNHAAVIDQSRCVACFNCMGVCKFGALTWGIRQPHN